MNSPRIPALFVGLCALACSHALNANELSAEQLHFFEERIRPVLVTHCYECHSVEADKGKGGLYLDSRLGLIQGGDSGSSLSLGNPEDSLLIEAIAYDNPDLEMPPEEPLPDHVVEDFKQWVAMGAPDPRESTVALPRQEGVDYDSFRDHWAYRPIERPATPEVKDADWPVSEIDHFILARLESEGLQPAGVAEPGVLLRRIFMDLVGLPPSVEQQKEFEADPSEERLEAIVDELLGSREFGERWGRHWLDMVRFAESTGGGRSMRMPEAWRYRDYVIRSFATGKPLDQMIREQIAGDLLPYDSVEQRREQLIATGFLVLGPHNYELQDKELLRMEIVDEQIDTIGQAFMAMTVGCARCHNHMFDPISHDDYFAMAAILRSTHSSEYGNVNNWVERPLPRDEPMTAEQQAEYEQWENDVQALRDKFAENTKGETLKKIGGDIIKKAIKEGPPHHETAMAVRDAEDAGDYHINIRGDVHNLGKPVQRGFLTIASSNPRPEIPEGESGRLQLANWVVSEENPLTSRVMANRIWQYLFGHGIVRSPANFGGMGEEPSHPELLDWLAHDLQQEGWSAQAMIRKIVLSSTYQQSSQPRPEALEQDPDNFLLARQSLRRMEAESIRDSMLHLAGTLEPFEGGPTFSSKNGSEYNYKFNHPVRSVYLPVLRNRVEGLLSAFDFANPNMVATDRAVSTVPAQALFLMNSEFVSEQSREAARRLLEAETEPSDRVGMAFREAFGRDPEAAELEASLAFIDSFPRERTTPESEVETWAAFQQALFASIDFRYVP